MAVTVKRNNYQHYDHVGQTMKVKPWRDDVVSFCNIIYTQENSQICNIEEEEEEEEDDFNWK